MPAKSKFLNRTLILVLTALSGLAISQAAPNLVVRVGYAPVSGLNLYYEIHGSGRPQVLIDCGLGTSSMPVLAKSRHNITVDVQGLSPMRRRIARRGQRTDHSAAWVDFGAIVLMPTLETLPL